MIRRRAPYTCVEQRWDADIELDLPRDGFPHGSARPMPKAPNVWGLSRFTIHIAFVVWWIITVGNGSRIRDLSPTRHRIGHFGTNRKWAGPMWSLRKLTLTSSTCTLVSRCQIQSRSPLSRITGVYEYNGRSYVFTRDARVNDLFYCRQTSTHVPERNGWLESVTSWHFNPI